MVKAGWLEPESDPESDDHHHTLAEVNSEPAILFGMRKPTAKRAAVWSVALLTVVAACTTQRANHSSLPTASSLTRPASVSASPLPGGHKLPPGAQVTSVVSFDGREVAAGADIPGGGSAVLPICYSGCNPIVWTSVNRSEWTATWGTVARGSIPGEQFVVGPDRLLLFNADEGTALWYSTDAVTWQQVPLPPAMTALVVRGAVWGHGRFVAILNNKYAGGPNTAYGESDTVWTSTDGATWTLDSVPVAPAAFNSLTVDPTGFRIAGVFRQSGRSVTWTSSDGVRWTTAG